MKTQKVSFEAYSRFHLFPINEHMRRSESVEFKK